MRALASNNNKLDDADTRKWADAKFKKKLKDETTLLRSFYNVNVYGSSPPLWVCSLFWVAPAENVPAGPILH